MSDTSTQNHPAVSKIRIEYEDGSHDEMELLDASQGLYNWDRKRPTDKNTRGGLYTAHRIAAQLFKTGLEGCLAEDQCIVQKQTSLLHGYIKDSGYAHDSTGHSILIKKRRAFRHNHKTLCMVE
jgi:hypothetical protein